MNANKPQTNITLDDLATMIQQGFLELRDEFHKEMNEFREEMNEFREEMNEFREEMKKLGGDMEYVKLRLDQKANVIDLQSLEQRLERRIEARPGLA